MLALAFNHVITCPLYQKVGTRNRHAKIDINKVASKIEKTIFTALIGLHAFTGCETVFAFAGKGNTAARKIKTKDNEHRECFSDRGRTVDVSPNLLQKHQSFTCAIYVPRGTVDDINVCPYQLFCAKRVEVNSF